MNTPPLASLHRLVWTALCAALMAIGAYLHIPLGPVPISLQTFFVLLAGFLLGPKGGLASVLLYLAVGSLGLPVFSGGRAGFAHLLGPTGGYLIGFVLCAGVAGLAKPKDQDRVDAKTLWTRSALFGVLGMTALYALGVWRLKYVLDTTWIKAVSVGVVPFLPGAGLKLVLAVLGFQFLQKQRLLPP